MTSCWSPLRRPGDITLFVYYCCNASYFCQQKILNVLFSFLQSVKEADAKKLGIRNNKHVAMTLQLNMKKGILYDTLSFDNFTFWSVFDI